MRTSDVEVEITLRPTAEGGRQAATVGFGHIQDGRSSRDISFFLNIYPN